ncbi:Spo0E family sporulation regulatory protein-aspartic acid phosphatase [Clostridium omnivorum]|uniref:GAF domain-containing protein n=1 Tax=Clostridium omnivorum TaxID=1604902 RepID=A0ABQ5N149_9CLOT|nr:Spo0E family sporulation regulatory protein-aspartic acid phosphatase [Clostridium sp. E14]GLC28908.1 hypothetical protein bsdE14_03180 [Clostridium sp. E14]
MLDFKMEEARERLFDAIDNCSNLTEESVVQISQKLDELINMYYKKGVMKPTIDYDEYEKELEDEWKRFVNIVMKHPGSRKSTFLGWDRCRKLGIDEEAIKGVILSNEELLTIRNSNIELIEVSKAYMDKISESLSDIPHMILLSDREGWVIDMRGRNKSFSEAAGICSGVNCSEKHVGNNGIGTCLSVEEPVLVYGIEHFGNLYKSLACFGIPIKKNGEVIGAMDVTVPVEHAKPTNLLFALDCINLLESELSTVLS